MKVDVIIPTYNRPKLVQVAIKSVLSQHSGDWELWVYDDGSDYDFKGQIIDKYTDPRIHFFQGPKLSTEERFGICRYAVILNMLLKSQAMNLFLTYATMIATGQRLSVELFSSLKTTLKSS